MTTNNLIGYDPLAWMDGADIEEETPPPAPEPAKKITRSRAKAKAEPVQEVVEEAEETPGEIESATVDSEIVATESDDTDTSFRSALLGSKTKLSKDAEEDAEVGDDIEVDVSIDKDGEIEIHVEAPADAEINLDIDVSIETEEPAENDVIESAAVEEIAEEIPVVEENAVMPEETHIEEAPIAAIAEPHIDLAAESSIKTVAALYDTLKHALDAHDAIEINAADVTTIDTATLQLLVSLKKDAPNLGKTVDIIYPSERFIESAKLLGLLEILEV